MTMTMNTITIMTTGRSMSIQKITTMITTTKATAMTIMTDTIMRGNTGMNTDPM